MHGTLPVPVRPSLALLALVAVGLGSYVALTYGRAGHVMLGMEAAASGPEAEGPVSSFHSAVAGGTPSVATASSVVLYPVTGRSVEEILESLLVGGPVDGDRTFFGMTETDISLRYRTSASASDCVLTDVHVVMDVVTTLPEWEAPSGVDYDLQRDWHQFLGALRRHEAEHAALAERGAQKVQRAVTDLRRPTCVEVEAEARRRLDRIEIEIEASHRHYDDQTGHGRTEGATWPRP